MNNAAVGAGHSAHYNYPEALRAMLPGLSSGISGEKFLYDVEAGQPYRRNLPQEGGEQVLQRSSALLQLVPHASDTLVVFCRAIRKEWSLFSDHWRVLFGRNVPVLMLEDFSRRFYTAGVPGLGGTFEADVAWIRQLAQALGCRRIVTCGSSAGGTGALMYGAALQAERMLVLSPITTFDMAFYANDPMTSEDSARVQKRMRRLPRIMPASKRFDGRRALEAAGADCTTHVHYPSGIYWDRRWAEHLSGLAGVTLFPHGGSARHNLLDEHAREQFLDDEILHYLLLDVLPPMPMTASAPEPVALAA